MDMDIDVEIDALLAPEVLFRLSPTQLAMRLGAVAAESQPDDIQNITGRLLADVHSGAVPPSVFRTWLPIAVHRVPSLIRTALLDKLSYAVRNAGIAALKRALARDRWRENGWDAAGGTRGLVEVFDSISIHQIAMLVRVVGKCNRSQDPSKAAAVEELVRLLMPTLLLSSTQEGSSWDSTGRRFLFSELALLIPACSSDFLLELLSKPVPESFLKTSFFRGLARFHLSFMRQIATGEIEVHNDVRLQTLHYCSRELILSTKPYTRRYTQSGASPHVSSGILFFLDLVSSQFDESTGTLNKTQLFQGCINHVTELAVRRKTPLKDIFILFESIISFVEKDKDVSNSWDHFPDQVIQCWTTASFPKDNKIVPQSTRTERLLPTSKPAAELATSFHSLIIRIIMLGRYNHGSHFARYRDIIFTLPPEAKLLFIKTLYRYYPGLNVDLEKSSVIEQQWSDAFKFKLGTFFNLPPDDAKWLFERVMTLAGEKKTAFINGDGRRHGLLYQPWWCLEGLMNVQCEAHEESSDHSPIAEKLFENAKRKAERGSNPEERLLWAKYCVDIAESSRSIILFNTVVTWTRRYLRDPVVGPAIYNYMASDSIVNAVSPATLNRLQRPTSLAALTSLVDRANAILSFQIETAILSMREPGHRWSDYDPARTLTQVVSARFNAIRSLSKTGIGSDNDLEDILLTNVMPLLLNYESIVHSDGQQHLLLSNPNGPLSNLSLSQSPRQYELRFLDNLARKRDDIWMKKRIGSDSTVVTLKEGWPRGLPVQCLFPSREWAAAAVRNAEAAPFMAARMKAVVFCDPNVALSTIPESDMVAIGPFRDSLDFAMRSYIGYIGLEPEADRESRLLEVWEHYINAKWTSTSHVKAFKKWLINFAKSEGLARAARVLDPPEHPAYPVLDYENISAVGPGPVEWDPRPRGSEHATDFVNSAADANGFTLLQCRFHLSEHFHYQGFKSLTFDAPPAWQNPPTPDRLATWRADRPDIDLQRLPLSTREAMVVSAILFLDATICIGSPRLLSKPFPQNSRQLRYPALYLDYDFLSDASKWSEASNAVSVLHKLVGIVPPTLLHSLACSMLKAVAMLSQESTGYASLLSTTMNVITILPICDNPELAVDIGPDVIRQLPEALSWYRHILSPRVIKRLKPEYAETMLKNFGAMVFDALEKQKLNRNAEADAKREGVKSVGKENSDLAPTMPTAPSSSLVKISTIKLLAQLLATSTAAPLGMSLEILRSLFTASRHIDVRRNVVCGVLELLKRSSDMEAQAGNRIYTAFASFSSAAAAPSERDAVSEDTWLKAEAGGPLPEVDSYRPLLEIFLLDAKDLIPQRFHADYVREVVLPLLDESTKQHNRWMRIFLSYVELTPHEASVTDFGPFGDNRVGDYNDSAVNSPFNKWGPYLPSEYLVRHRTWALSYIDCLKLENISDKMDQQDKGWRDTNAGEHWLSYFDSQKSSFAKFDSLALRISKFDFMIENGITREQLLQEYYTRATIVVGHPFAFDGPHPSVSLAPFRSVCLPLRTYRSLEGVWHGWDGGDGTQRKHVPQLLVSIIAYIENLRNDEWVQNPHRNPVILPHSLLLETYLLPYPHLDDSAPQRYTIFATAISDLVSKCAASPSCASDFVYLKDSMVSVVKSDCISCALVIGRQGGEEQSRVEGSLKVQLATTLLDRAGDGEIGKSKEVSEMIKSWKESPSEWLRLLAWERDPKP